MFVALKGKSPDQARKIFNSIFDKIFGFNQDERMLRVFIENAFASDVNHYFRARFSNYLIEKVMGVTKIWMCGHLFLFPVSITRRTQTNLSEN